MDEFFANDFSFPDSAVTVGKDFVDVRGVRVAAAEAGCMRLKASLLRPLLLAELQRRALASLDEQRQKMLSEVAELDRRHRRVRCEGSANAR